MIGIDISLLLCGDTGNGIVEQHHYGMFIQCISMLPSMYLNVFNDRQYTTNHQCILHWVSKMLKYFPMHIMCVNVCECCPNVLPMSQYLLRHWNRFDIFILIHPSLLYIDNIDVHSDYIPYSINDELIQLFLIQTCLWCQ